MMSHHFKGKLDKVFQTKGQWASRKRPILVDGIIFNARCNDCNVLEQIPVGSTIMFDFILKGYVYDDRHINVIEIVEGSLAVM